MQHSSQKIMKTKFGVTWVAQATSLCRPATRRTEREQWLELMGTRSWPDSLPPFRSAGRRPGRVSRPRYPIMNHALSCASFALLALLSLAPLGQAQIYENSKQ